MNMNYTRDIPISDKLLTAYYRSGRRGFHRIWHLLREHKSQSFVTALNQYGVKLLLSPIDYIDSFVLLSGYYESEVLEGILPFLGPGAVFWDIGANFGLHAITAKFLKPEARVICIEPSPPMLSRIQANARLNNLEVENISVALSDSQRFRPLHLAEGNPGMTSLKPLATASYSGSILCWCDTGDNLVASQTLPSPTIIKLDVEGSEVDVLRGLKGVLQGSYLKAVVLEANPKLIIESDNELYRILTTAGFQINMLTRNERTQHHLENFIAVRS